jgi:hypothetical protein
MDRADNAAQSAKESVQEVHIFLSLYFFREFILTTMAQWMHNIRFKNHNKPKTKGQKE